MQKKVYRVYLDKTISAALFKISQGKPITYQKKYYDELISKIIFSD